MALNDKFSEKTVREDLRIKFTRQLYKLREGDVKEVVFPNDLTGVERKFLHKLAEELGLKSKSNGKGNDRRITVTKPSEDGDDDACEAETPLVTLNQHTLEILNRGLPASLVTEVPASSSLKASNDHNIYRESSKPSSLMDDISVIEAAYNKAQAERVKKPTYETMARKRASLPAFYHQAAVSTLIKEQQIVLISGETGCGKTTQVPQFILDDAEMGPKCRMVVTQPRRISAVSVAERIAAERGEKVGGTIGYNIRLESERCPTTQVLFVTPGVLLRKLQSDPLLEEYSHIVIDEAHERDRFTEFLLIILRSVCARRSSLKLVLMSATMQTNKLSSYFGNVPHIHIGASVFPVQEFFLEHVLRFTDYASKMPKSAEMPGLVPGETALAAYLRSCQDYFCAMCKGGPFKSPEELGTHCALCTGTPTGASAGAGGKGSGGGRKNGRGTTSADELVRILSSSAAGPASAPGPEDMAPRSQHSAALLSALKPGSSHHGGGIAFAPAAASSDGAEHSADAAENSSVYSSDDSDDEADHHHHHHHDDGPASAVVSVGADQAIAKVEDEDGSDALVRQYQFCFDDSLVDYDLIIELLLYVFDSEFCKEGSVLIFLPGWDDISNMHRTLSNHFKFGNNDKYKLIQLHSGIPKKAQSEVFDPLKPGEHKIILSTNIAETSITIDDVTVVIDSGRLKEKQYDPYVKLAYLKSTWISQASARQRKGRAGRTRAGVCFHLFSKRRHASLPEFQDSEILRMPLEELVLQAKQLGLAPGYGDEPDSVQAFLMKALDPPPALSIMNAITLLQAIGCLDDREQVTTLGKSVSKLPLDPRIGRIVLLACLCGCGPAVLATSTAMGYRDPFLLPTSEHQRAACNAAKANLSQGLPSDQVALLKALEGYGTVFTRFNAYRAYQFCDENFLSRSTMSYLRDLIQQLAQSLKDSGILLTKAYFQRNNGNMALLMSLIGIGLYPDVGSRKKGASVFTTEKGRKAKIHSGSVNSKLPVYKAPCKIGAEFVGYQDLVQNTSKNAPPGAAKLMMLNTTPISPFALLLTCGTIREVPVNEMSVKEGDAEDGENSPVPVLEGDQVLIRVDGWLKMRISKSVLTLVYACRAAITRALEAFLADPDGVIPSDISLAVDAIVQALSVEQPCSGTGYTVSANPQYSSHNDDGNQNMARNNSSRSFHNSQKGRNSSGKFR